jgi:hypothetical protein
VKLYSLVSRGLRRLLRWISNVLLWTFFVLFLSPIFVPAIPIIWFMIEGVLRRDVAAELIAVAKKDDGVVETAIFGDRVCVIPGHEGYISRSTIVELYPGRKITHTDSDESHGRWLIILPEVSSEFNIEVYAINPSDIDWVQDKKSTWYQQIHCPKFMRFMQIDGKWTYHPEFE